MYCINCGTRVERATSVLNAAHPLTDSRATNPCLTGWSKMITALLDGLGESGVIRIITLWIRTE